MLSILVLESVQIRQPLVQVGEFSTASCYRAGKRRNCRRAPPSPRLNLALLLFPSRTRARVVTYLPLPPSSANPPLHSRRLSPSASLLLSPFAIPVTSSYSSPLRIYLHYGEREREVDESSVVFHICALLHMPRRPPAPAASRRRRQRQMESGALTPLTPSWIVIK